MENKRTPRIRIEDIPALEQLSAELQPSRKSSLAPMFQTVFVLHERPARVPDLELFRDVRCDGAALPMTSLARESSHRVRVTGVRQRLLELSTGCVVPTR